MPDLLAPFPWFGGKRTVAADVWARLGAPVQYIEPFCGSAAVLLAAPKPASLEVICDGSGYIANFWRAVKCQTDKVAEWADYPVSHIDLGARHVWLLAQRERIGAALQNVDWPGDARVAGYWLWGQCSWIGSGWCEWKRDPLAQVENGRVPQYSSAGMGVQALGQVPQYSYPARGLMTSSGRAAWEWLHKLAARLERVRIMHGDWTRCLNHRYAGNDTAVFLDPPYRAYERVYSDSTPVADAVEAWAREHAHLRIALCGHRGDYDLPGWDAVNWKRQRLTYGGSKTTDQECIWYSPACLAKVQADLFEGWAPPAAGRSAATLFDEGLAHEDRWQRLGGVAARVAGELKREPEPAR